jgi:hypothetical protein
MIISRISNGLGNQLFQYALGRNLAEKNNTELVLDTSSYQDISTDDTKRNLALTQFNISARKMTIIDTANIGLPNITESTLWQKIKRRLFRTIESFKPILKRKLIIEPYFQFCPDITRVSDNHYISGNWQSEKYFNEIEGILRKELLLKNSLSSTGNQWMKKIQECNSVSLHIRRGDYVENQRTNHFHGICTSEYYDGAIKFVSEKTKDIVFFIFSVDIQWAKKNLKINYPVFFVSDTLLPDYEELVLMSNCKHNIIANSTFSWWGAWLNNNSLKIVVAPKKWFKVDVLEIGDLIPQGWVRI